MNPIKPNSMSTRSFHSFHLYEPNLSGQNVTISSVGGNINAKVELLRAPTRDMTAPRFGMAAASPNVMITKIVRVMYSP